MTTGSSARGLASALLLCALPAPALAGGDAGTAAAAPAQPPGSQPSGAQRRPPPMVLMVPLGVGVLLPLTLPTTMPRVRAAPPGEPKQDAAAPAAGDDGAQPGPEGR